MTDSKFLMFATWGVACPLVVLLLVALKTGGVDRAVLVGLCLAPTAITYHFAQWIERIERTLRIRFLEDRGVVLRVRTGLACSLLALTWATAASLVAPLAGGFDLRIAAVVLGPMIVSLSLASRSIERAVERLAQST